jgi:hypothetical protein
MEKSYRNSFLEFFSMAGHFSVDNKYEVTARYTT